jgi:hypothetical protein
MRDRSAGAQGRSDKDRFGDLRFDAPVSRALFEWSSMQYGHCVVNATASAISSLYLRGIAPSVRARLVECHKRLHGLGRVSL